LGFVLLRNWSTRLFSSGPKKEENSDKSHSDEDAKIGRETHLGIGVFFRDKIDEACECDAPMGNHSTSPQRDAGYFASSVPGNPVVVHPVEIPFSKQGKHDRQHAVSQLATERAHLNPLPSFIIVGPRADLCGPRAPATFEFRKYRIELARKLAKQLDQIQGVLQRQGGPLSSARAHGMGGVADKILRPMRGFAKESETAIAKQLHEEVIILSGTPQAMNVFAYCLDLESMAFCHSGNSDMITFQFLLLKQLHPP
jgi:hypothetical protein